MSLDIHSLLLDIGGECGRYLKGSDVGTLLWLEAGVVMVRLGVFSGLGVCLAQ